MKVYCSAVVDDASAVDVVKLEIVSFVQCKHFYYVFAHTNFCH